MAKKDTAIQPQKTLATLYRTASTGSIATIPFLARATIGDHPLTKAAIDDAKWSYAAVDVWNPPEQQRFLTQIPNVPFALVVHALDEWAGQKFIGHNSALSRGSLTAWAGEAAAIIPAHLDTRAIGGWYGPERPVHGLIRYIENKTGYAQWEHNVNLKTPGFRNYIVAKYGLGAARTIINRVPFLNRMAKPLKETLSMLGGAL